MKILNHVALPKLEERLLNCEKNTELMDFISDDICELAGFFKQGENRYFIIY